MAIAANLGMPRMGVGRELKWALERHWKGKVPLVEVEQTAWSLRSQNWQLQKAAGIQSIPSNDFSYYDHVLDTACLLGCVPSRYRWTGGNVDTATYFAMARGGTKLDSNGNEVSVTAMEMTKWFDTNYHYIVPEFEDGQKFSLASSKPFDHFTEAKSLGIHTRPVLLGPVSFLLLGKSKGSVRPLDLLDGVLAVYEQVLAKLAALEADWVQVDEPCLVMDLDDAARAAYVKAYARLAKSVPGVKIMLATYFEDLNGSTECALTLPVAGVHIDTTRAPALLDTVLPKLAGGSKVLSLGVIDGRNIWRADLDKAADLVIRAGKALGQERVQAAPSCSLLHVPMTLRTEEELDPTLKSWLAFAEEKLAEIVTVAKAATAGKASVADALNHSRTANHSRLTSPLLNVKAVRDRMAAITPAMETRKSPYAKRIEAQQKLLGLPEWPTTTIGSFPQTNRIREARAHFKAGKKTEAEYIQYLREEIAACVKWQEDAGIDVLVHGEFERNDMVEHFASEINGYAFTANGWVQSYGSRCVKPPVIFGDVSRKHPMTVEWSKYAQSLTRKPMKGMLTGPVTMLQWSFVRDDQPRSDTCLQLALALRDEVTDLEKAGIRVIQIDEPAIREGLPLRRSKWDDYLAWAVRAFRVSASGVADDTQIHTHMCYSEFNDIIGSVAAMDADVVSIETSRSQMELLDAFAKFRYPNGIGPGVYDIHSPRVPPMDEMRSLLQKALGHLKPGQLWVNPDCGLKTRHWDEVRPALEAMVAAARAMRSAK